jgi:acetylornithine deacetylase
MIVGALRPRSHCQPRASAHGIFCQSRRGASPNVTGDERNIHPYPQEVFDDMGLEVDMWETDWTELKKAPDHRPVDRGYEGRRNIVARRVGTGGGRSPWLASVKNGRIDDRGASDMKSGVAGGHSWS